VYSGCDVIMIPSGDVNIEAVPPPGKAGRVEDPRVYLAAERTFLAWVRTSLALMGFGFLIARFGLLIRETEVLVQMAERPHRPTISPWLGFAMVCLGVIVCLVSAVRYRAYIRALETGVANPSVSTRAPLAMAAILVLVGLAMAAHILAL
jgi:putative membrane protein